MTKQQLANHGGGSFTAHCLPAWLALGLLVVVRPQAKTQECDGSEDKARRLARELDTTRLDAEGRQEGGREGRESSNSSQLARHQRRKKREKRRGRC